MENLFALLPLIVVLTWALVELVRVFTRGAGSTAVPYVPSSPVRIICGDCAGDEIVARVTYLTNRGRCDRCGGRSYVVKASVRPRVHRPKLVAADTTRRSA